MPGTWMCSQLLKWFLKRWDAFHPRFKSFSPTSCPGCVLATRLPERMDAKTLKALPEGGSLHLRSWNPQDRKDEWGFQGALVYGGCAGALASQGFMLWEEVTGASLIRSFHPRSLSLYQAQALGQRLGVEMVCPSSRAPHRPMCWGVGGGNRILRAGNHINNNNTKPTMLCLPLALVV